MREQRRIIDERGEILSERNACFTDSMNDEGYRFPSHKLGTRMFADVEFPEAMTDADIGKMTRLSKRYVIASTNMIGYRRGQEIKAYTASEIGVLAGCQVRQGRRFVAKMLKLRVMQRINTNSGAQYYINPAYFMPNGKRLSLDLFLLFRDELTPLLPAWAMAEFLTKARTKDIKADTGEIVAEAERIVRGK